jgi:hypothetical protein
MKPTSYVYSPNNIHAEIRTEGGLEIYPAGPGVPSLPNCLIAADMGEGISIFARNYGAAMAVTLIMRFDSPEAFLAYCESQGRLSEGGQRHF